VRRGGLSLYGREVEAKTLALLDSALLERHHRPLPQEIQDMLRVSAAQDVRELLPHLEKRAEEYAQDAIVLLQKRADAESKTMREILESQQKHIESTIAQHDQSPQLVLNFPDEEKRQLEANRRYWDRRLIQIREEMNSEPKRIRRVYEVCAQRIEPIGLVYLWPLSR
jgi:galactokinase